MTWHRLRGHRLQRYVRYVDTSKYYIGSDGLMEESGRIERSVVCSCGADWVHVLVSPLRNKWVWQ